MMGTMEKIAAEEMHMPRALFIREWRRQPAVALNGMNAETAERAFEPFFTTKPVGQGTGLGLSQVYGFVRQSNGHAEIRTAPGHGTTVRILIPLVEVGQPALSDS